MSNDLDDIFDALKKKGFKQPNDKIKILVCEYDDTIRLKPPYDLPIKQNSKSQMAAQINMSVAFFMDMVSCKLGREHYEEKLGLKQPNDHPLTSG